MPQTIRGFILILFLASMLACNDDGLPEPTETGEHILALKIDGEDWEAKVISGVSENALEASYTTSADRLVVTARRIDAHTDDRLEFSIEGMSGTGTYTLGLNGSGEASFRSNGDNETIYRTTTEHGGDIEITRLDVNAGIAAGTFSLELLDRSNGESIELKSGRFDVHMDVY